MLAGEHVCGKVARVLVEALSGDETDKHPSHLPPPAGPARAWDQDLVDRHQATAATGRGEDVTGWYRERYRGVVAAERLGGEVLLLLDEGESYGVNRLTLAFAGTDREVLVRCWVDHVPKSRIDPTRPLFGQWSSWSGVDSGSSRGTLTVTASAILSPSEQNSITHSSPQRSRRS